MRTSSEYGSLQLAYDPARLAALVTPERLTTARFEAVFREMSGFGMLDLLFEDGPDVFVVHAVGVDTVVLATREGPPLIWPSTLALAPAVADAIEERVTPWLRTLTRGRGVNGEYLRAYRPSAVFTLARERGLRGAVPTGRTLPLMSPFVYARRFARGRDVYVGCAQRALAAAVVGTVAAGIELGGTRDEFAERWYGVPCVQPPSAAPDVAIVDDLADPRAAGAPYVVATRPGDGGRTIVVPIPVPQDHLFTFDPADAPAATSFGVRAVDAVNRPVRVARISAPRGGSGGRIALVVRDDAGYAPDADTDAIDELARRLRAEGLDVTIGNVGDPRVREADIIHVFGGVVDSHLGTAADLARSLRVPYVVSVEPLAPYARYEEDASVMTLRVAVDDCDRRMYRRLFDEARLRFDDLPHEQSAAAAAAQTQAFVEACRGASGIVLGPAADLAAFRACYPQLDGIAVVAAPLCVGAEPDEEPVEALIPRRPFLLLHGPLTRRSCFGYLLATLGEPSYDIVVAGPVSEVDLGFTLRRISGSQVVFIPDPTPGQSAALYRRAHAAAFAALRPPSAARLIRATACGVFPLVAAASPLARLVPAHCVYDPKAAEATVALFDRVMQTDVAPDVAAIAGSLAEYGDADGALRSIVDVYARCAVGAI